LKKMSKVKSAYPPGDFAIWIVIYVELVTFGALFLGFAYMRSQHTQMFNDSQLLLNQTSGFINTLILITSSYFVAYAVKSVKEFNDSQKAAKVLLIAMLLGAFFLILKVNEFADKYAEGINLSTNTFFMFYFLLTVFHFMHVVLGLVILFNLYKQSKIGAYTSENSRGLETGASYWHLVDLLWIVLFPLVYIIR